MKNRLFKIVAGVAAIGSIALGGTALAASQAPATTAPAAVTAPAVVVAPAAVSTEAPESSAVEAADTDNIQDENGADDATEVGTPEAPETGAGAEAASTEVDGPGGHADEVAGGPENNVDHQFEGEE